MSTPSLLTIHMATETLNGYSNTSASGTINIEKIIQPQTIIWRGYRVQMDTQADALSQQLIYVDFPWLNSYCLTDGISYMSRLPIMLDNAVVTLKTEMTMPLRTSNTIQSQFNYNVYNRNGTPVNSSQVVSITLYFSFGTDSIQGSS